jgi:hypothetical protein
MVQSHNKMMRLHHAMVRLHNKARAALARLHGDEGGNILVLTVAASLLLVALVWVVIGTGQRMVQKETIQSSADAAAFSAAVIKAKGLNVIAFCNLVMAMLFALVMLLRIVKYALIATAIFLGGLCGVPSQQWACAAAAAAGNAAGQFANWEAQAEQIIKRGMQGLATTERAVAQITPVLALVEAYHVGTDGAYAKNFGKGQLITVAYPLPTQGLPVQDGTCQDLANQAVQDFKLLPSVLLDKLSAIIPMSKTLGQWIGDAVAALLNPLAQSMCGDSATVPTKRLSSDCAECRLKGTRSFWTGSRVIQAPDGTIDHVEPGACAMSSMPGWSCPASGPGPVRCDSDPSARYQSLQFNQCEIDEHQQVQTGGADWPKPLVLTAGWTQQQHVRAFTVLTDTNMEARRRAVAVASRNKPGAPLPNQMLGMAQADFFAWNGGGHDDLFHMDWRARLVRFSFSDGSDRAGGLGGAVGSGVPAGADQLVAGVIAAFLGNAGAGLQDQFLLH